MSIIGNIIWFLFGGFLAGLIWFFFGLLWCCTVIGIPVGLQCFKFGVLSFFPFGKDVKLSSATTSLILNIFWLIFGGFWFDFVLHNYWYSLWHAAFQAGEAGAAVLWRRDSGEMKINFISRFLQKFALAMSQQCCIL